MNTNKINEQLLKIKKEKRMGLMTHIVFGYPDAETSIKTAKLMAKYVDFIEIQIPFSDPMADGPTIMEANKIALDNKVKVKDAFDAMRKLTKEVKIPLLFMTYFNIVNAYGVKRFCKDAAEVGCAGFIVPDMPLEEEENDNFSMHAEKSELINIRLLSPASTSERIRKNSQAARGFIYFSAQQGTTGERKKLAEDLAKNLKTVRQYTKLPIAVGFGISGPAHVKELKRKADIVIIGSAILNIYKNTMNLKKIEEFLKEIREEL